MDPGYYAAAGSLKARSFQLEVVANNLANASTVGYRADKTFFSVFNKAAGSGRGLPLSRHVNDGTILAETGVDASQGNLKPTNRDLDLAIEGNAFFTIQTPQGIRVTRDGRFQLGKDGRIEAVDGSAVLGKNGPIILDPQAGAFTVLEDGTIQQGGQSLGQLDLRAYANPGALKRVGAVRYDPGSQAAAPVKAKLNQGFLEQSGVELSTAMIDLIRLNRLFEMSMKVASTLSNDLDSRVINDVAVTR